VNDQKTNAWRKSNNRFTDVAHSACQTFFHRAAHHRQWRNPLAHKPISTIAEEATTYGKTKRKRQLRQIGRVAPKPLS